MSKRQRPASSVERPKASDPRLDLADAEAPRVPRRAAAVAVDGDFPEREREAQRGAGMPGLVNRTAVEVIMHHPIRSRARSSVEASAARVSVSR
jgi:hypothetical protein